MSNKEVRVSHAGRLQRTCPECIVFGKHYFPQFSKLSSLSKEVFIFLLINAYFHPQLRALSWLCISKKDQWSTTAEKQSGSLKPSSLGCEAVLELLSLKSHWGIMFLQEQNKINNTASLVNFHTGMWNVFWTPAVHHQRNQQTFPAATEMECFQRADWLGVFPSQNCFYLPLYLTLHSSNTNIISGKYFQAHIQTLSSYSPSHPSDAPGYNQATRTPGNSSTARTTAVRMHNRALIYLCSKLAGNGSHHWIGDWKLDLNCKSVIWA